MTEFIVIIPARYASTRLPGKALLDIGGMPMVVRVGERARASGAARVVIATDHESIRKAAGDHSFEVCMTREDHASGTDRIAEAADQLALDDHALVVNVQGDEPFISPALIAAVAEELARRPQASMSTACHPMRSREAFLNPNVVKVVLDRDGCALYFSRAPIPCPRDATLRGDAVLPEGLPAYRHVGIYAYRAGFLRTYAGLPACELERFEALEQLRALWHGHRIAVHVSGERPSIGIDTPEDLREARRRV